MSKQISELKLMTAIDLEMNQPSGKIISIGAVIGSLSTGEIIEQFHRLILIDEPITEYITNLTGITNEQMQAEGITLIQAYEELKTLHKRSDFTNPVTWGKGDTTELNQQLQSNGLKLSSGFNNPEKLEVFCFGRREFDCKQRFQEQCILEDKGLQAGLKKAMQRVGLKFEGKPHNALNDALNTFKMYRFMLKCGDGNVIRS